MENAMDSLMETCGFKRPGDAGIYKNWHNYLDEAAAYAAGGIRSNKKRSMILLGLYSLFIEFLAGRLPDTLDEASDGATYMSRAAIEFRDKFISSTTAVEE